MPKLILINGPAGVGKSTIAQKYIDEHPLALSVTGDEIIAMLGQWLEHESAARKHVFALAKAMAATHLQTGHDVLLPYLIVHPEHADEFEAIAKAYDAKYIEITLMANKADAVRRLLKRGTWGEPGTEPLTQKDIPIIEALYDAMEKALRKWPRSIVIEAAEGNIDGTYEQFMRVVEA